MKNGIVILNYNDSENTSLILEDIKNYKILDKIVVVDNKSTDDSVKKLKKYENNKIKLIEAKENKGYAAGNNLGIKYLIDEEKIDNIIISNPDIIVTEKSIKTLIKDLENKEIDCIAPRIKEPNGISRGWKLPTFYSEVLSNIPFFRRFEQNLLNYKNEDYQRDFTPVDVIKGCFFIIKKEAIEDIHYLDENTFLYYEEIIMGYNLKRKSYRTMVDNRVEVIHALSQSVDRSVNRIRKFKLLKQSQYYYEKYVNHMHVFQLGILRILVMFYSFGLEIERLLRGGK